MATHSSILTGKSNEQREAWLATVHGVAKSSLASLSFLIAPLLHPHGRVLKGLVVFQNPGSASLLEDSFCHTY